MNENTIKTGKVTIYHRGMLGYRKVEAKQAEINVIRYAQYPRAVEITFRKPRQRNDRGFVETYRPSVVVLEGWGHFSPADAFTAPEDRGAVIVSQARHSSCSPAWDDEFSAALAAYLERSGAKVVADFRGFNTSATA